MAPRDAFNLSVLAESTKADVLTSGASLGQYIIMIILWRQEGVASQKSSMRKVPVLAQTNLCTRCLMKGWVYASPIVQHPDTIENATLLTQVTS